MGVMSHGTEGACGRFLGARERGAVRFRGFRGLWGGPCGYLVVFPRELGNPTHRPRTPNTLSYSPLPTSPSLPLPFPLGTVVGFGPIVIQAHRERGIANLCHCRHAYYQHRARSVGAALPQRLCRKATLEFCNGKSCATPIAKAVVALGRGK